MSKFSERLKALRKEKGFTQVALSKLLGISTRAYQCYESEVTVPHYSIQEKLASLFDVSLDYLMGRTDSQTVQAPHFKNEVSISLDARLVKELSAIAKEEMRPLDNLITFFLAKAIKNYYAQNNASLSTPAPRE